MFSMNVGFKILVSAVTSLHGVMGIGRATWCRKGWIEQWVRWSG